MHGLGHGYIIADECDRHDSHTQILGRVRDSTTEMKRLFQHGPSLFGGLSSAFGTGKGTALKAPGPKLSLKPAAELYLAPSPFLNLV
jgi:hypothetical protein